MRSAVLLSLVIGAMAILFRLGTPTDEAHTLQVVLELDGNPLACGETIEWNGHPLTLRDLRLFVHQVELLDAVGHATPFALTPDARWQTERVALLDFEDGRVGSHGSSATRMSLEGRAATGEYVAVRLRIGVPFVDNHADPARAAGPLTGTAMHWGWRGGYKFIRLDAGLGTDGGLRLHLGSTGCAGTFANITHCTRGNRPQVTLPLTDRTAVFDLADLLAAMDPETVQVCMSAPDEPACADVFSALGLDLQTGAFARGGS